MRQAGPGRGHPAPHLGDFLETNVRLYGVDDAGHHSVVFRSLEASRLLTVLAARWGYRLPYVWSRMRVGRCGDTWTWSEPAALAAPRPEHPDRVRVGEPVLAPTALDVWLTARWGLHHRAAGRTWWTPNAHEPWPLRSAESLDQDDLLAADGFARRRAGARRFSSGVRTVRSPRPSGLASASGGSGLHVFG